MSKIKIKILENERYVINKLYRLKIDIYNIEKQNDINFYTIDENDLEKIEFLEYEIISVFGLKRLVLLLKSNMHFLISLFLSIILMFIISNIILEVKVIHNDKEIRELLEEELKENNIKAFTFKKSFKQIQQIKKRIKEKYQDKIEWLEIIDNGMSYTVRVEERIITEKNIDPPYCNIISTKDAIVGSIKSSKGQSVVDTNDSVIPGSILISGEIKFNEEAKNYVCAEGLVFGTTWYSVSVSLPYDYTLKNYTGNEKNNIAFEVGSTYNRIFKVHMKKFDTNKKKIFSLAGFTIYKETNKEYNLKDSKYTKEEALQKALELGREKLNLKLDKDAVILSEKVLQTEVYDSIIEVDIFYSVKELISEKNIEEIPNEEIPKEEDEGV